MDFLWRSMRADAEGGDQGRTRPEKRKKTHLDVFTRYNISHVNEY